MSCRDALALQPSAPKEAFNTKAPVTPIPQILREFSALKNR